VGILKNRIYVSAAENERDRAELRRRMQETEARFRAAAQGRAKGIEWRSALIDPDAYVPAESRSADLIVTGPNHDGSPLDPFRRLNPSAFVMQAGRPVFFVPREAAWLKLSRVLLAWKDTREARRAAWDALPLLQQAEEVNVVEVLEDGSSRDEAKRRVDDVVAWLTTHGVTAFGIVPDRIAYAADQLESIASDTDSDLLVAGAYGHSRLTEWVFGGVTRDHVVRCAHKRPLRAGRAFTFALAEARSAVPEFQLASAIAVRSCGPAFREDAGSPTRL
jgi:nucleotide-binding universal stress UspA family protein